MPVTIDKGSDQPIYSKRRKPKPWSSAATDAVIKAVDKASAAPPKS